jgi:hypothetical protein
MSKPDLRVADQVREACRQALEPSYPQTIWDPDDVAALHPEAWAAIIEQVEEVKRCSDDATFLFLCARAIGPNLCVLFADDMTKPPGYAPTTEFRAAIATVQ